ncbi:MAG TPA: NAD(P)/FAD-dependent oxidoreductase [Chlorobiota bacterium]|nr:NAD(P)/FAD-dependent oxidoreductase [Chlorobiota bacterium]
MVIDCLVLGAGAAGLMCAATAAATGRRVVLIDHNDAPGKKIRISGGGRCNFTNVGTTWKNFVSQNPEFARSALSQYEPQDFIELVNSYGIRWHEKKLGQLFCDDSAQQIISMLVTECERAGVKIHLSTSVREVTGSDPFSVVLQDNTVLTTQNVVVATGGLSIPKLGASDLGYSIAAHYGIAIVPTAPALVPFLLAGQPHSPLAGVSVETITSCGGVAFEENVLFTHRGVSGPAILQISSYWNPGDSVEMDLLPHVTFDDVFSDLSGDKRFVSTVLSTVVPSRLADVVCGTLRDKPVNSVGRRELVELFDRLQAWQISPTGTEGYAKAEVTRGGVSTAELSQKTMESKKVRGLYFIGEVVDVTGWLGGYNFQWAWSSAVAAGRNLQLM